jgi:hypothetical protein
MSVLRPLPPRPNLEFEHKEAKALLRGLRSGDPDAMARAEAQHPAIDASLPANAKLADAQLIIAREYGFASWPKLVRYFGDVERQRHNRRQIHHRDFNSEVKWFLARHNNRRALAGRSLAAYVPRFYGMPVDEIFASTITDDEARLVVARSNGFASWELLQEYSAKPERAEDAWTVDPQRSLYEAMKAGDLLEVQRILAAHPDLLHPGLFHLTTGRYAMSMALHLEREVGREVVRPLVEWLETQGWNAQTELNRWLCGRIYTAPEDVSYLIQRGADPNWIAPNGYSVIEHAVIRYWNGESVDVLARHATPPQSLWVGAGIGDVDMVRHFLDRDGKPTEQARRSRPNFDAIGQFAVPAHPDADDEEILTEALLIAVLNGRTNVIEYLASRGANVNSLVYESPLINTAVGNGMTAVVDSLIRCGADLDLKGVMPDKTARELAKDGVLNKYTRQRAIPIAKLCGLDPEAILAELTGSPTVDADLRRALELASDDAFRREQKTIDAESLFFGLLRAGRLPLYLSTKVSRMDVERFSADYAERIGHAQDRVDHEPLPFDDGAQAFIDAATLLASERRHENVTGLHLLLVLANNDHDVVADLIGQYGGDLVALREALQRNVGD